MWGRVQSSPSFESGLSPICTLCRVGSGEYPPEHIGEILQAFSLTRHRTMTVTVHESPFSRSNVRFGFVLVRSLVESLDTVHTHSWLLTMTLRVQTSIPGSLNLDPRVCGHLSVLIPAPWRGATPAYECANMAHGVTPRVTVPPPPSVYKSRSNLSSRPPTLIQWLIRSLPHHPAAATYPPPRTGPRSLRITMSSSTSSPCKSTPSLRHIPSYSSGLSPRFVPPVPVFLSELPQHPSYLSPTNPFQNVALDRVR